jgi:hypothetical protein
LLLRQTLPSSRKRVKAGWKRLERAKFKWPAISDGVMRLSSAQLAALFEGLDWRRVYAPRIRRPQRPRAPAIHPLAGDPDRRLVEVPAIARPITKARFSTVASALSRPTRGRQKGGPSTDPVGFDAGKKI